MYREIDRKLSNKIREDLIRGAASAILINNNGMADNLQNGPWREIYDLYRDEIKRTIL